jgi:ubiquitin-like protein Pup
MPTHDEGGQSRANRKADEVEETVDSAAATEEVAERQAKLTEDVDDLLDEIDDVLETNAEDFVRGYVQKGGQ